MLDMQDLERLQMLVTVANYDGDKELKEKLATLIKRQKSMDFINEAGRKADK